MPDTLPLAERHWLAMADPETLYLPKVHPAIIETCRDLGLVEQEGAHWRLTRKGERFRFDWLQNGNSLQPAAS